MIPALALALPLLLTSAPARGASTAPCYFVSNTRIRLLPSCSISPSTIDQLTEEPTAAATPGQPTWRGAGRWRPVPARPAVLGDQELERRLEVAQQERADATARRVTAEAERDAALRERDAALRELAAARKELAAEREEPAQASAPGRERDPRESAARAGPAGPLVDSLAPPAGVAAEQEANRPRS